MDGDAFLQCILKEWPEAHYVVFQEEVGQEGTKHYQGFIQFVNRTRITRLKKYPNANTLHWEARKGTPLEAATYCKKEESRRAGPWEHGILEPRIVGKKKELTSAIELMKKDGLQAIAEAFPEVYVKHYKGLLALNVFHLNLIKLNL